MDASEVKRLQRKIERARDNNNLKEAKDIYMELADYFSQHEKYDDAIDAYKSALFISEERKWKTDVAVAHRMLGETYCSMGEYEKAVKFAELYLNYAIKIKDKTEEQRGYATKGRIFFCWAEFLNDMKLSKHRKKIKLLLTESLRAYEKGLKICECDLTEIDVREKMEMKSRLFQNLGLVMGSLKKYKEANSHFASAIQINKAQNFKENLYWCYSNQGDLFLRADECTNACTYFDLALSVAASRDAMCEALKCKAKAYLKMGNNITAKNTLREAYKQKLGKDPDFVEQLRIVVYLCKIDKMIETTPENDYTARKKLFEKQGDAYCVLKQYSQGVKSYLKMLDNAERSCKTDKELLPCYTSLAQTYKDDEKYTSALNYCQKELELIEGDTLECCKTYFFMAELYEFLDYDYKTISETYLKVQEIAQKLNDRKQMIIALQNIIRIQEEFGYKSLAEDNQGLLNVLLSEGDISDSESDNENVEDFSCDVDDKELFSDVEDDKPRYQSKRNCYKIKRNQKGETELHVATIQGNYNKVRSLIEKGHPVNEQDLAGWTVLHEACNHGHVEIVELLLSNGADINNPGGKDCGGITPLHDAAENGHFEVVELLLRKGACTAVVTNQGDTPLDCIKRWRSRVTLNKSDSLVYEKLCNALKTNLDSTSKMRKRLIDSDSVAKPFLRTGLVDLDIDEVPDGNPAVPKHRAAEIYKSAIDCVRRRNSVKLPDNPKKAHGPLISEEEAGDPLNDDWLEDDISYPAQSSKRRKITHEPKEKSLDGSPSPERVNFQTFDEDDEVELVEGEDRSSPVFNVGHSKPKENPNKDKSENKVEMVTELHTRADPDIPSEKTPVELPRKESVPSSNADEILHKFKIRVENDSFLIPVPKSKLNNLTVEWLIEETGKRVSEIHGKAPDLVLTTEDGAIVSKHDPVSVLADEKIQAKVIGWKKLKLSEKYAKELESMSRRDVRLSLREKPDADIGNAMDMCVTTTTLKLQDLQLEARDIIPVFRTLASERISVKVVDLSRNFLGDEGIEPLMSYLETCSFESLHLPCNGITVNGIRHFAERLKYIPEENLKKIQCLDLRFNRLKNASLEYLGRIVEELPNLKCLRTEYCDLLDPLSKWEEVSKRMAQIAIRDKDVP